MFCAETGVAKLPMAMRAMASVEIFFIGYGLICEWISPRYARSTWLYAHNKGHNTLRTTLKRCSAQGAAAVKTQLGLSVFVLTLRNVNVL